LSYPFGKAIDWDEFIALMNGIGVVFNQTTAIGPKGQPIPVSFFENKMEGEAYTCVVDITDRKQILLPSTIRGILKSLHIHPKVCGFHLG
jgi:hypothetical protein